MRPRAAHAGLAVLLFTAEYGEMAHLADRVIVMRRGRPTEELHGSDVTEDRIVHSCHAAPTGACTRARDARSERQHRTGSPSGRGRGGGGMSGIQRVGVVGGGLMGAGVAEVCARAALETTVVEVDAAAAERARSRVLSSLERAVASGKLDAATASRAEALLTFSAEFDALAAADVVVEAVVEAAAQKVQVFEMLDKVVESPSALLASNTSSIPIMKLAMATQRPEAVIGIHFFNPVPVLRLVEIVTSLLTSPSTTQAAEDFAVGTLGKRVIRSQDRAGFIVNALLIPYILSAIRMLESGFATKEDIDAGMVEGCAHPMGPLALADLIGLDTTMAVAESLYEEFKEPLYAPPPLLSRMVDAGLLGRKAGRGFYEHGR
jgi:3-hydroxybutyryl-CoA dehydrogenase